MMLMLDTLCRECAAPRRQTPPPFDAALRWPPFRRCRHAAYYARRAALSFRVILLQYSTSGIATPADALRATAVATTYGHTSLDGLRYAAAPLLDVAMPIRDIFMHTPPYRYHCRYARQAAPCHARDDMSPIIFDIFADTRERCLCYATQRRDALVYAHKAMR